ncbi:MAG: tetratricopeptide repeat protein [Flammeovirgaceae bacterium]|nr:MAG: tetratricopeptide repeat protein [Flammeovirgaceae bacterium]
MDNSRLIVLVYLLGVGQSLAQLSEIDSLKHELKRAATPQARIDILNSLSNRYLAYQPEQASHYANEALQLARKTNYPHGEILALNRLGEYEFRQSNYAQAVELTTESLKLAVRHRDSLGMALAYRVLGNTHTFGLKQYDQALQYQLKAMELYQLLKDKRNIAGFCGNITWIYASTNQNLEEAHRLADLGIHLSDSLNDKQLLSFNYNSKGLIYTQQNKPDSALKFLNLSTREAEKVKDFAVISYNKSLIGNVYLQQGQYKKALNYFTEAANESRQLNLREVLKESYLGLSKAYANLGNFQQALQNHIGYTQLKDSLINWETSQKALMAKLAFEEEKREARIVELEQANEQARREQLIFSIGFAMTFILMAAVIGLVVRNNWLRQQANQVLKEKNEEIETQNEKLKQANDIKDKFFSIIGHDLRSPLVSLKGLLGMLLRNEITEEEFKLFAPKLNQLVIGTNETLENLLQWAHSQLNGYTYNPVSLSLNELTVKCFALFADAARAKSISLVNDVPAETIWKADRNHIDLLLRNLVHNAIKYTHNGGTVTVSAGNKDGINELCVTDTGIGMTSEQVAQLFNVAELKTQRGTGGERGTGLGLMLCREMVSLQGGKLLIESTPGKGSVFKVQMAERPGPVT